MYFVLRILLFQILFFFIFTIRPALALSQEEIKSDKLEQNHLDDNDNNDEHSPLLVTTQKSLIVSAENTQDPYRQEKSSNLFLKRNGKGEGFFINIKKNNSIKNINF